jgi:hypothetical protein
MMSYSQILEGETILLRHQLKELREKNDELRNFVKWANETAGLAEEAETLDHIANKAADLMRKFKISGNIYSQKAQTPIEFIK